MLNFNYVRQTSGLEPRKKKLTSTPGTSKCPALSIIYCNRYQCWSAVQIKYMDGRVDPLRIISDIIGLIGRNTCQSGFTYFRLDWFYNVKHATFLSHGRTPEMCCFSISLVFTLPHVYFLSLLALAETITLKIWERPMLWLAKCSLPVAVRGSKTLHA